MPSRTPRSTLNTEPAHLTYAAPPMRICLIWLAVLAVISAGGRVHGQPIAVESYGAERPADAERLLAPVLGELERSGFPPASAVARRLESRVSRASRALDQAGR